MRAIFRTVNRFGLLVLSANISTNFAGESVHVRIAAFLAPLSARVAFRNIVVVVTQIVGNSVVDMGREAFKCAFRFSSISAQIPVCPFLDKDRAVLLAPSLYQLLHI